MSGEITDQVNISDKRAAILETTLKLLSERGLHDTPMSMIVKESGVSTGTVYHYFENKDELITDLYHEIKTKFFHSLLAGFDPEASYEERFLHLWKTIVLFYMTHPVEMKFLEQYENSPYYDANWVENYVEFLAPIFIFFKRGVEEKVLKNLPMEVMMELGTSAGGALAKRHVSGVLELTEELIDAAALACWDAIKR